jgi:transcriptional regulator with XRE-family HTH domain
MKTINALGGRIKKNVSKIINAMNPQLHIGEAIKQKVQEQKMCITEFAHRLGCERTNVYAIFKSKSIDIDRLQRISRILHYDFIQEYYLAHPSNKKYLVLLEVPEQQLPEFINHPLLKSVVEV